MLTICKSYKFCYAHRIWCQELSGNKECTCRRAHGHSCTVDVYFGSEELNKGMIVDFNELKVIKEFLDGFVDHRFLMDIEDPLLKSWMEKYGLKMEDLEVNSAGFVFDTKSFKDECEIEFFNSLVILPFVPTSENLALWLFSVVEGLVHKVNKELNKKVKVVKLRWWESESSFAEVG